MSPVISGSKTAMKWWVLTLLLVLFIGVLGVVWNTALAPIRVASAVVSATTNTATGVIHQTLNADNALDKYRKFHNLYQGMQKNLANFKIYKNKVGTFKERLSTVPYAMWADSDKDQLNFLEDTKSNFKLAYNRSAAKYNELASRMDAKIFKGDSSLPQRVSLIE